MTFIIIAHKINIVKYKDNFNYEEKRGEKMSIFEEKAKKLKAEYHKNWAKNNKEKVKIINNRYWLNKAKKELEKKGEI